jgi:hypothetical protein
MLYKLAVLRQSNASLRFSGMALKLVHARLAKRGGQASFGTWFACVTVLLVSGLFALNTLGPYLGLHHAGALTMFSNRAAVSNNHFFLRRVSLSEAATYVAITRVAPRNVKSPPAREFQTFATWTNRNRRLVSLNLVRYHASRVCASSPNAGLRLSLLTESGHMLHFENVCVEPEMLKYTVLSSVPECRPACSTFITQWARGAPQPQ